MSLVQRREKAERILSRIPNSKKVHSKKTHHKTAFYKTSLRKILVHEAVLHEAVLHKAALHKAAVFRKGSCKGRQQAAGLVEKVSLLIRRRENPLPIRYLLERT